MRRQRKVLITTDIKKKKKYQQSVLLNDCATNSLIMILSTEATSFWRQEGLSALVDPYSLTNMAIK